MSFSNEWLNTYTCVRPYLLVGVSMTLLAMPSIGWHCLFCWFSVFAPLFICFGCPFVRHLATSRASPSNIRSGRKYQYCSRYCSNATQHFFYIFLVILFIAKCIICQDGLLPFTVYSSYAISAFSFDLLIVLVIFVRFGNA